MESRKDVYEQMISPLMNQIVEICLKNNIPMVAAFQCAEDRVLAGSIVPAWAHDYLKIVDTILRGETLIAPVYQRSSTEH